MLGNRSGIETLASKSNDAEIFSDTCAAKCQGSQSLSLSLSRISIIIIQSVYNDSILGAMINDIRAI